MKMHPLKSSNLEACHYDEATKTLTVKFINGGKADATRLAWG